eukprot:CAMPEP_0203854278 /NCGR_PEP_ID=MMETSP0359-20131031/9013_1 /ASSEMBLY_ACC=CAM_ASM_000338 /TAXON_ID=268821 /ORGANISM="Scrippsiella Hangoei, Strain SHTV-5" /LENGTH=224 /DNA_ID=CAMNT_0050770745 /DNA_START=30 /DNA_END=700 /DNA_ORIENTATION=+
MSSRSKAMKTALASGAGMAALNSMADCFLGSAPAATGTPARVVGADAAGSLRGKGTQGTAQEASGSASIGPVGLLSAAALGLSAAARPSSKKAAATAGRSTAAVARRVATVDVDVEAANGVQESGPGSDGADEIAGFGGGFGGYTKSNTAARRVVPTEQQAENRQRIKVVYVVLESQYQSSMSAAVRQINKSSTGLCVECVGYLLEEIRDQQILKELQADLEDA